MEGYTKITYQDKTIRYADYSIFNGGKDQKQNILEFIKFGADDWVKQPPNSVLALLNVTNLVFDMDILHALKENNERSEPHQKKVAVIGVTGLLKTGYNFVVGLANSSPKIKLFETELEAKEWLVSD